MDACLVHVRPLLETPDEGSSLSLVTVMIASLFGPPVEKGIEMVVPMETPADVPAVESRVTVVAASAGQENAKRPTRQAAAYLSAVLS
jgi:hypothetical protein